MTEIVKEQPVKRTLRTLTSSEFLDRLQEAQNEWNENGTLPGWANETEYFWITQRYEFMEVSFIRGDFGDNSSRNSVLSAFDKPQNTTTVDVSPEALEQDSVTRVNRLEHLPLLPGTTYDPVTGLALPFSSEYVASLTAKVLTGGAEDGWLWTGPEGSTWDVPPEKNATPFYVSPNMAKLYLDISRSGVLSIAGNATIEASDSYLYQPATLISNIRNVLYDQYEAAMPVATMADCFRGLLKVVYDGDIDGANETKRNSDKGFRTAPLIRFVGQEDGLLAYTVDGPRLFINIEDYMYYNHPKGRKTNTLFKAALAHLRSDPACGSSGLSGGGARMHWGKAGWPDPGCWHGDTEYNNTWCDFGCAKMALDPSNKFADSAPDRWTWAGVDLEACCGPDGFAHGTPGCDCVVKHEKSAADCPPSPYYTYR
ncbi:hypothetical protein FOA52_012624 [Chlamydomonas sp. UWO 241]|nr:hypothetical protein FOA52_012624 [Chlamydomonas sp. UWO 241]